MSAPEQRDALLRLLHDAIQAGAPQKQACLLIGLSQRTLQRWQKASEQVDLRTRRTSPPPHKLTDAELAQMLDISASAEFAHLPPSQIVPRLADKGIYIASESSFYRVLKEANQLKHRRTERPAQPRSKPRALCAQAPNQVYSWDITYLPYCVKGKYFYLYVFLDIFSRKIVGWQVYEEESAEHASEVVKDICARYSILPEPLTLHSDNGGAMKGATLLFTLENLGIARSLKRSARLVRACQ